VGAPASASCRRRSPIDVAAAGIPENRVIRQEMNGCDYWWIEWGGDLDVVRDNERIRDELQAVCYGIWDHIKNSGRFDAENLSLEWIGAVPGKREYRRFEGDHVLTQHDVLGQTEFDDRVAFGGWSIDLHPVGGVYASERGSRHWHPDGNYHIPLRCLYSRDVGNLWMAGRDISASHVAFGSTRVMATCAILGEAAGIGAALTQRLDVPPRALAEQELPQLQRALVRADASTLGIPDTDPANLALSASASASSTRTPPGLDDQHGSADPREGPQPRAARRSRARRARGARGRRPRTPSSPPRCTPPPGPRTTCPTSSWRRCGSRSRGGAPRVRLPLAHTPRGAAEPGGGAAQQPAAADPSGATTPSPAPSPCTAACCRAGRSSPSSGGSGRRPCTGRASASACSARRAPSRASRALGGYARPYGGPNMWISGPAAEDPQPVLELAWEEAQTIAEVDLLFDDDLNEDLINLHHHRSPDDIMPTLVRNARLETWADGAWHHLASLHENRERRRVLRLDAAVTTSALRLVVEDTNGVPEARVVGVRVYGG
jgi:hypothetical protein